MAKYVVVALQATIGVVLAAWVFGMEFEHAYFFLMGAFYALVVLAL